jgi:DNA-directed RNA polymerase subunit H (RpoH/RPB5)
MAISSKSEYGLTNKLYNSRNIILNQLEKQGYDISEYRNFSINEVNIMAKNKQQDMILKNTKTGEKLYVNYFIEKSLRPQNIHEIIEDLYQLEKILTTNDTLFIIVKDKPNDTLINLLKNLYAKDQVFISILFLAQLQFNILEHDYVPNHRKLTKEEAIVFRKTYNIKIDSNIPEISRFDPVSLVLGIKPGDICHIVRKSKTSIEDDYYRICINK